MDKEEAERWAKVTIDKFFKLAEDKYNEYDFFHIVDKQSWINGFLKGYVTGKQEEQKL